MPTHRPGRHAAAGFTLAELLMVAAILIILAATSLPVAKTMVKREKEAELRLALRTIRLAIDDFKRTSDSGRIEVEFGTEGYPSDIEKLVEAIEIVGGGPDEIVRFLRDVPVDPMTGETEWGKRSFQDRPDSTFWGGQNLYDVYSLSEGVGLNGVPYAEW